MAVDSILPKPELRFLFGLTAFLQRGRLCFGLAALSGEVFCIAFRVGTKRFFFVFHWLAVWSESETINSLSPLLLDTQGERHPLRIR